MKIFDNELHKKLELNDFNCLCTIDKVVCMCEEFLNSEVDSICHCGVFKKTN